MCTSNHYEGTVQINPKEKHIECHLSIDFNVKVETEQLSFFLYRLFELKELTCNQMKTYSYEEEVTPCNPFINECRRIVIDLKQCVYKGDVIHLSFQYAGRVEKVSKWEINRITEELVKLNSYAPWYPFLSLIEESTFDFEIKLPLGYQVMNANNENGSYHLVQKIPSNDCTILASHSFKKVNDHLNSPIQVFYMDDLHQQIAEEGYKQSNIIFNYYLNHYGPLVQQDTLSLCLVSRERGGGYSRPGLIVLQGDMNTRYIAHEIAHLWWNKAKEVTDDWLNESFAEYSALMYIREHDMKDFQIRMNNYKSQSKDTPPIPLIKREDEKAFVVLYQKGPVLLNLLENRIGSPLFLSLLKEMHVSKVKHTDEFFVLLRKVTGNEASNWFYDLFSRI